MISSLAAGGAEIHLLTVCRHLKRLGVDVRVAYLKPGFEGSRFLGADFEAEGVPLIDLRAHRAWTMGHLMRLAQVLRRERPTVLHSHLPRADVAAAVASSLDRRARWVCSVHGMYDASWAASWALPVVRSCWRKAKHVVAISHAVREWLVARCKIPQEKVGVIHYGIEPDAAFSQRDLRSEWNLHGRFAILALGRFEPGKGHDCLIRAMVDVVRAVPNALLLIAGQDPRGERAKLQQLVDDLGLQAAVQLLPFQRDVGALLRASDVFALASRSEGFGQVVIEAMSFGRPVVASRIPPLTEIVVEGLTGRLAEVDNPAAFARAIVELALRPEDRSRYGTAGRTRVMEHFTARRMAEQLLTVYTAVGAQ